jgi:long-chain acyl-CoA synthetase
VATVVERSTRTRTIPAVWRAAVADGGPRTAYLVERDGTWEPVTWAEAATIVEELANGLLALGIRKGDAFAIFASTTLEWALFDFALALVGGVTAPIYATSSERDCLYVVAHSGAVGVVCENEELRAKVAGARLDHVLTFADFDELRARGRAHAEATPTALDEAVAAIEDDDLYTFIYTSGTTGPPKGCMIKHRNYYAMAEAVSAVDDFVVTNDVMLLYLPLAHNFGRLMHLLGAYQRYTIAFCPDPYAVADALPRVRPTVLPSVPRVWEKVHAGIVAKFAETSGLRRRLVEWSLGVGRRVSALRVRGERVPTPLALRHRVADVLVYSKVKKRLGGRLRIGISGGAPLAQEIAEFFHALDILVLEGYGLTECTTAATVNRPSRLRFGTVGPPLPGIELRLDDDGELLVRGPTVFAGYFREDDATREVLMPDGWLRTGDLAQIDDDGFLTITDRKKDIIVTAGGKNVAPQNLENELKLAPEISQALVVGDRRPYLVALLTLADGADPERVQQIVDGVNRERSRYEQIKRFAILPRDFSTEDGELTPTLKLRRRVCEQHFAREIDSLYVA